MKQVLSFIATSMALVACTSSAHNREDELLAIGKKYMEAVETKNVATMDSLLAQNYIGYGPSIGDSTDKEGALASWKYNVENLYESFVYTRHKELAVTVTEGAGIGDWILNWAHLTIKYKDGRGPVNLWVNAIYRVEDGKIVESRTFYNEADALRQLGYSFAPPPIERSGQEARIGN